MLGTLFTGKTIASAGEVLSLFIIPIGGGIPGGVLLAKSRGFDWIETTILYFVSDVFLACVFEPLMLLVIAGAKRSRFLAKFAEAMRKSTKKATDHYGAKLGPIALVVLSFGVDPMTGRGAAKAMGHGFISGWALAITGDMFYYALLMVSTLFLNGILGDGTQATLIILVVMTVLPILIRKFRGMPKAPPSVSSDGAV
jgi:hypothetical protein